MSEFITANLQFLSGGILGLMLGFALAYIGYSIKFKRRYKIEIEDKRERIEADALVRGINDGVALEAEAGWSKTPAKKKSKKAKKSSKKSQK